MPLPLLATKLNIPPEPSNLVHRQRLWRQLSEGAKRRLTLICAPAGFGKTTLLSEWINAPSESKLPVAWLTLHERDNDPYRFWIYLLAALDKLNLDHDEHILSSNWPQSLSEDQLTTLLDQIATSIPGDFVLVLDDYHVITDPSIHDAIVFLLDHVPPQMHLIIASRVEPPTLAYWRARGQCLELRDDDLRFTLDETGAFLNQAMQLNLSAEMIATLDARTEGWIAGLQLAALSLRDRCDAAEFIHSFAGTHHYLVDYLAEQVLLQQPPEIQQFLLETSILDQLTGSLCDAVTGQAGGQATLHWLERMDLFLVPLGDDRQWYRYHHLFAEFLQARLRQGDLDRVRELQRRAATWYERNDLMEEAVRHALAAQDFETAVRLIGRVSASLWYRSENLTLLSWLAAIPEELIRSDPRLCLSYATTLAVSGQLDAVEPFLRSAEAHLEAQSVDRTAPGPLARNQVWWELTPQGMSTAVDYVRAFVARFRNPADAIVYGQRALARIPVEHIDLRGLILLYLGHAHLLDGDAAAANRTLIESSEMCRATGNVSAYLSALHYLAQLQVLQGRLRQAAAIYQEAIQFVAAQRARQLSGVERAGLGDVLREWGDLDAAARYINEGLELAEAGGDFVFVRDANIARARLDWARGDLDGALYFIHKAEQAARGSTTWHIEALRAQLWLAHGNPAAAEHWAQTSGLTVNTEPRLLDEYPLLVLARVLLAQGRMVEAEYLLARLQHASEFAGRMGRAIEVLLLQALVHQASGNLPRAVDALSRALALAEPEGYVRLFVDEGEPLAALLAQVSRSKADRSIGYARKLLSVFKQQNATGTSVPPHDRLLTDRELEILRLIAAGRSYQAISQELTIALSTVQSHIKNIYQKLDAHSALEAVAQARRLNLMA